MDNQLNGNLLLESIQAGGRRVIAARSKLNLINVFPVADSDTGNNLASLMRAILDVPSDNKITIKDTLERIAMKAMEGAKGNSGVIFAQYFNGLSRFYNPHEKERNPLGLAFSNAVKEAYEAVQNPQEGTILTVMNIWSNALDTALNHHSLSDSLEVARGKAYDAVNATQFQHSLMRKHGVVDAGAQGFFEFIDGVTDFLLGIETTVDNANEDVIEIVNHHHDIAERPVYKFCMEVNCVIDDEQSNFKAELQILGDSMVIAKGLYQTKVHIHTNEPQDVITVIERYGKALTMKVDTMNQQFFDTHINEKRTALITDSIADIPLDLLERYNVHVLPLTIIIDETEHLDKVTIDSKRVLEIVEAAKQEVSTSLANEFTILRLFENLEPNYDQAVFITVSSALSGTYNAVLNAIIRYQGKLKVEVIDSKLNSIAQGLLVKRAGDYIEKDLPFDQLVERIEEEKERISIYVLVHDLNPMIKSGRIPSTVGKGLQLLKMRPIVTLDKQGKGKLLNIGFSARQNQRKILKIMNNQKNTIQDSLLGYTSSHADLADFETALQTKWGQPLDSVQTSSIIALSAGKQAVAIAFYNEKETTA